MCKGARLIPEFTFTTFTKIDASYISHFLISLVPTYCHSILFERVKSNKNTTLIALSCICHLCLKCRGERLNDDITKKNLEFIAESFEKLR